MKSAKDMRDELRELRKSSKAHKPVSKMRIADVAAEIESLKGKREETPAPAATPADKSPKKMMAKISDVKVAKEKEFPVAPSDKAPPKKKKSVVVGGSGAVGETTKAAPKRNKLEKLMAMLGDMTDSDEE